jgi:small subunit ribosomal protein S1
MRVKGKVRNMTNFGAFVELEEGIDGLVHVSDMSWTKRVAHPSEVLKKGDTVEVVILSIDKEHRRISLGLKQVSDDPWPQLADRFPSGLELTGTVNRLFDRGAIVDLGDGIEGFVPLSQLGLDDLKRPNDAFEVGESLTMKVTRVDVPNHRLILSVKAWLAEQDDIALAEWTSKRNQVRANIAANPPVEVPTEPRPREKSETVEEE